jgi:hypothetical protein
MLLLKHPLVVTAMVSGAADAHYANMGQDSVSCYIYDGIKGTPHGDMIVKYNNNTWVDRDDPKRQGTITPQTDITSLVT